VAAIVSAWSIFASMDLSQNGGDVRAGVAVRVDGAAAEQHVQEVDWAG
jgi:hypothetical protein